MRRSEAGFGLLETLIALTILGITVVFIVGGMATSILSSDHHRKQADGNALLLQAAENVKSDAVPHLACATPGTATEYLNAARGQSPYPPVDVPSGWAIDDIIISDLEWYDGAGFVGPPSACPHDDTHLYPLTLQQITLQVTSPGARAVERVTFVKGKP